MRAALLVPGQPVWVTLLGVRCKAWLVRRLRSGEWTLKADTTDVHNLARRPCEARTYTYWRRCPADLQERAA